MSRFVQVDRDTAYLLPPSVQEWLPEDHLARFIVKTVEQVDLTELSGEYAGRGGQRFRQRCCLRCCCTGTPRGEFSSRRIERATYDSVALRFIAANTHPDHDAIAAFRNRFVPQLTGFEPARTRLHQLPEALGRPERLLSDIGYCSKDNVRRCEVAGHTPLIAMKRGAHRVSVLERLALEPTEPPGDDPMLRLPYRSATREGMALYARRKTKSEPVLGMIKNVLRFRQVLLRGLEAVNGGWRLISIAWNLHRIHTMRLAR